MTDSAHDSMPQLHTVEWTKADLLEACPLMSCKLNAETDRGKRQLSKDIAAVSKEDLLQYQTTGSENGRDDVRKCFKSLGFAEYEIFNDPVHGSIELHPLLVSIVNTPAFDRLKDIKQLGGVHKVFHGATHTRFEHSLGTCFIAGEYMRRLQYTQPELNITVKEILIVEIAALCHDLGHGPLSYVFINEIKPTVYSNLPKRANLSSRIFERHIYKELKEKFLNYGITKFESLLIQELIDHDLMNKPEMLECLPERRFLYEIVANTDTGIDVVKWDYFARDCQHLGVANEFDWRRLMKLSRVINVDGVYRICYRDKEVNHIWRMFSTRYNLHHGVYKHSTVLAVEHMIGNAVCKVRDEKLLLVGSDKISIKTALKNTAENDFEGFLAMTDSIITLIMNTVPLSKDSPESPLYKAKELLKKVERREIIHLAAVDRHQLQKEVHVPVTKEELTQELGDWTKADLDDLFIKKVSLSYDSEERKPPEQITWKQENPLNYVYFYKKETPWKAQIGGEIFVEAERSLSPITRRWPTVLPENFKMDEVRVYSPNKNKRKEVQEAYSKAKRRKL